MDLHSLEGKVVRITITGLNLQDPFLRPKIGTGEETITTVVYIDSVDELGIWVKIPEYPVYNSIARKKENLTAYMLIRSEFITSIVHFPDVAEDNNKPGRIGFMVEEEY